MMSIHLYQGLVVSNYQRMFKFHRPPTPHPGTTGTTRHDPLYVTIPPRDGEWCMAYPETTRQSGDTLGSNPLGSNLLGSNLLGSNLLGSTSGPPIDNCPYGADTVVAVHMTTPMGSARDEMLRFGITCVLVYDRTSSDYLGMLDTRSVASAMHAHRANWSHQPACDWMRPVHYILGTDRLSGVCARAARHYFTRDSHRVVSQGDLLRSIAWYRPLASAPEGRGVLTGTEVPLLQADDDSTLWDALDVMLRLRRAVVQVNRGGSYYRLLSLSDACVSGVSPESRIADAFPPKERVTTGAQLHEVVRACIDHDVHQVYIPTSDGVARIVEAVQALQTYADHPPSDLLADAPRLQAHCGPGAVWPSGSQS